MKHISEFDVNDLSFGVVKNNRKKEVYDVSCSFDIEVSSYEVDGEKSAFMYIWMLQIGVENDVYYGRSWEEFVDICEKLKRSLYLEPGKRELVIYCHNLSYEFQFMRNHFSWSEVFAIDERKPLNATTDLGIQFRCSYLLSGYSLAKTAENMENCPVQKMQGDLDYNLVRTSTTPLTDLEMVYCENDVLIVTHYIESQREIYGNINLIPSTNTGRVRKYVKDACYYNNPNHRKSSGSKYKRYRKIMEDLTLTPGVYQKARAAFQGGYTHANSLYMGKTIPNVTSIDFTSSYPSVMISELFPMGRFQRKEVNSVEELENMCVDYCMIFDIYFEDIEAKFIYENYLSKSKCYDIEKGVINNGRIAKAKSLKTTITEIDYDIIKENYSWSGIGVENVYAAPKGYLPKAIVDSILNLYEDKTKLKNVKGSEVEYMLSKGMLNSVYGMSVTNIVRDDISYSDDGWKVEDANIDEKIEEYNDKVSRFLYYPWGIWVTAYARRNLWSGIFAFGEDYVYSDTDSIKLINYENHGDYIQWFNAQIIDKTKLVLDEYGFNHDRLSPETIEGVEKTIGVWDYEGTYELFKTLGAKRYIEYHEGKITITVAGLGKKSGAEYLVDNCDTVEDIFRMFDHNLHVPSDKTGKLTHTYIDHEIEQLVVDYKGESMMMKSLSAIHLGPCEFTLSIGEEYMSFIANLSDGYLFKGITAQ